MFVWLDTPVNISPASNDQWVTVDLSGHIPSGSPGVLMHLYNTYLTVGRSIGWRKKGSTDAYYQTSFARHFTTFCGVDEDRALELRAQAWASNRWQAFLLGYFESSADAYFVTDPLTFSRTSYEQSTWIDCSLAGFSGSDVPSGAFLMHVNANGVEGVRKKGSSLGLTSVPNTILPAIVGVDSSKTFQWYSNLTAVSLRFYGYPKRGMVYHAEPIDVTPPDTFDAWVDLPPLPDGATGAFYRVYAPSSADLYGLRPKGGSEIIYTRLNNAQSNTVQYCGCRAGTDGIIQVRLSSSSMTVHEVAYTADTGNPPTPTLQSTFFVAC